MTPTPRQIEILAAVVETGSTRAAAHRLGMTFGATSVAMSRLRARTGLSLAQLVYIGLRDGWLVVPGLLTDATFLSIPSP